MCYGTVLRWRLASAGAIALAPGLAESMDALLAARIPKDWLQASWQAASLGTWFQGLLLRHDQLHKWLNAGRPKTYWLTGFFNPQVTNLLMPGHYQFKCISADM